VSPVRVWEEPPYYVLRQGAGAPLLFYMRQIKEFENRVTGTETEYGVVPNGYTQYIGFADDIINNMPAEFIKSKGSGDFMANGMLAYVDGSTPELATAEHLSFSDVVHAEMAQDIILNRTAAHFAVNEPFEDSTLFVARDVRKRVVSDNGNYWGYHISMSTSRGVFDALKRYRGVFPYLAAHLATQAVFAGAGLLETNDNKYSMLPAQKAHSVEQVMGLETTNKRPLINIRDEPHSNTHKLARLHVITTDPNMNPATSWLKLGALSWIVRLGEIGTTKWAAGILPENPVLATRVCSNDETLSELITLTNGKKATPLDIQEKLVSLCEEIVERNHYKFPDEELAILKYWRKVIDTLKRAPESAIYDVEWIARKQFLEAALSSGRQTTDGKKRISKKYNMVQRARMYDKIWDSIDPKVNACRRYMQIDGAYPSFPQYDQDITDYFVHHPPTNTRAYGRSVVVRAAALGYEFKHGYLLGLDWDAVTFDRIDYKLDDPRNPYGSNDFEKVVIAAEDFLDNHLEAKKAIAARAITYSLWP
jgi:hypothetical protein